MSTHEESHESTDKRIPKGYKISYHELRGYDSPDRWYEARCARVKLGDFGSFEEALDACVVRAGRRPKSIGRIKTMGPWKLRVWRGRAGVALYCGRQAIRLTYEAAEDLKNMLEKADSEA